MTRIYLKYKGVLRTSEFEATLTHQQVKAIFDKENFKPDDNRFMIVYK